MLTDIGLNAADMPHHSTLVQALRGSRSLFGEYDSRVAMVSTFFNRETASIHYCWRTQYRVYPLNATALVGTATQAVPDVHWTTKKRHNAHVGC